MEMERRYRMGWKRCFYLIYLIYFAIRLFICAHESLELFITLSIDEMIKILEKRIYLLSKLLFLRDLFHSPRYH